MSAYDEMSPTALATLLHETDQRLTQVNDERRSLLDHIYTTPGLLSQVMNASRNSNEEKADVKEIACPNCWGGRIVWKQWWNPFSKRLHCGMCNGTGTFRYMNSDEGNDGD